MTNILKLTLAAGAIAALTSTPTLANHGESCGTMLAKCLDRYPAKQAQCRSSGAACEAACRKGKPAFFWGFETKTNWRASC